MSAGHQPLEGISPLGIAGKEAEAGAGWGQQHHLAFLGEGVPVALLIDLDDPAWHTTGDVIGNLDGAAMAEVGEVVLAWIRRRAAAGSKRPR